MARPNNSLEPVPKSRPAQPATPPAGEKGDSNAQRCCGKVGEGEPSAVGR
jgi:hypothetical protein